MYNNFLNSIDRITNVHLLYLSTTFRENTTQMFQELRIVCKTSYVELCEWTILQDQTKSLCELSRMKWKYS